MVDVLARRFLTVDEPHQLKGPVREPAPQHRASPYMPSHAMRLPGVRWISCKAVARPVLLNCHSLPD